MNRIILIPTIILGTTLILIYTRICWKQNIKFEIYVAINAILHAGGLVGGIALILSSIFDSIKQFISDLDLYIFIAGIAILVISIQEMHNQILKHAIKQKSSRDRNLQDAQQDKPLEEN